MTPDRYHLTLTSGDRPVMHGWWAHLATAERKYLGWIGEHGSVESARVTLIDTADGRVIRSWPSEP